MGLRDRLRDSARKDAAPDKRGIWHSKAYHRFFEGYSETTVPKPNGKGSSIQRVYTGNYYRQELSAGQRMLLRLLYVVLFLSAAYLFVWSATLPWTGNATWYVVSSQVLSVPCLFWILVALFFYVPAGNNMTVADYRSSSLSLQKATLGSAIGLGVTAVATLIFIALNPADKPVIALLCALRYMAGGIIAFLMNRIERKVNYLVVPALPYLTEEPNP